MTRFSIIGTRWSKLLINASFSGVSAVCGTTFGNAASDKASRRIVQAIIKKHARLKASMLQDLERGRGRRAQAFV